MKPEEKELAKAADEQSSKDSDSEQQFHIHNGLTNALTT